MPSERSLRIPGESIATISNDNYVTYAPINGAFRPRGCRRDTAIAPTILIAGLALLSQRGHPRLQPPLIQLDSYA